MRVAAILLALTLGSAAQAQVKAPATAPATAIPGFTAPPAAQPAPAAATAPAAPAEKSHAEVAKKAKPGREITIGSYLTIDKTCHIGERPTVTFTEQPKNGKVRTRRDSINLSTAAGVPRNKCLGVSPMAIAVMYVGNGKFKGDDTFAYQVTYPDGRERDVKVTVSVQ